MTTQTSTQAQVIPKFGEQKKAFSIDKLKRLVNAAKSQIQYQQIGKYLFITTTTRRTKWTNNSKLDALTGKHLNYFGEQTIFGLWGNETIWKLNEMAFVFLEIECLHR
ncbi:hypothetical protein GLOIN_2v1880406 [Rhizophagus irregularis DAOM 181602=DAOM 197198]|nr:hypothetical protein GLOIN_2v1880406 [Rhizophagus irregularis DAOM 181602=DAOM 197198]